jgi:hypothetical protein
MPSLDLLVNVVPPQPPADGLRLVAGVRRHAGVAAINRLRARSTFVVDVLHAAEEIEVIVTGERDGVPILDGFVEELSEALQSGRAEITRSLPDGHDLLGMDPAALRDLIQELGGSG